MKKILIFSLAYFPRVSGAEIAIQNITKRISDIEFHVVTLCFGSEPRYERIENVHVYRVGWGSGYLSKILYIPLAALKALALHKENNFDGGWVMMTYMLFPLVIARVFGLRLPYALTLQDGDPFEYVFNRWYILPFRSLLRWGFRHATVIQTISTYLAGWAKQMGYTGHIEVVPNGYDGLVWSAADMSGQNREVFWKNKNITDSTPTLITTSRLVRKNAIDIVIRALAHLPTANFIILGKGPEQSRLEDLAKELKVRERVYFLGEIKNTAIIQYLNCSDVFVRPSRSEGMGNSFIEAMAAGTPVVATQEGGIADFLFDEKRNPDKSTTGWAVDKESPEQIALAVKNILARPEQVKKVTETARKMVIEKYDWNMIARNMRERVFARLF